MSTINMAQPKLERILQIPVSVAFRPAPSRWRESPNARVHLHTVQTAGGVQAHDYSPMPDAEAILDVWRIRERFFTLSTEEESRAFLNETGPFSEALSEDRYWVPGWADVRLWQRIFKEFLIRRPDTWEKWLNSSGVSQEAVQQTLKDVREMRVAFRWNGHKRIASFLASDTLTAMLASVVIDHLRGAHFKLCARPDCRKVYEQTSRHRRNYCSQYCAHFQSLRRMRARCRKER